MSQQSYVHIRLRRDSAANWTANNPVLKVGEPGLETDTRKLKFGDGITAWRNLPYSGIDINDNLLLENIDDRVASLIKAGSNISINYDDIINTLTIGAVGLQLAGDYATLVNGKIPAIQLPSYVDDVLEFANLSSLPVTGESGKIYVTLDSNKVYRWSGSAYVEISASPGSTDAVPEGSVNKYYTDVRASAAAPVQSVAGRTGVVTLGKSDVGLGNVDNTSDLNKPISTATQTALDGKANASHTHDDRYYTESEVNTLLSSKLSESTDRYIVCKNGDDILSKYATAKLLTPGGNALSATNRAYLIVMPGVYPLSAQWEIDAEFVDVIGLGSTPLDRGCNVSVTVTGYDINVSANNVRIKGIGTASNRAVRIDGDKPLQVFEECSGGEGSFGVTASGTFTNCSGGHYSFGSYGTASGTFTNCSGGVASFGGGDDLSAGTASGTFTNCSGGFSSFGGWGTASGTFKDCSGGDGSFGGYGGTSSGSFTNCVGGDNSFSGLASGTFTNCSGGDNSFGGAYGTASGTFKDCSCGNQSFGGDYGNATGNFINCTGGNYSFGGYLGTASGTFTNCSGGNLSFGGGGIASGFFKGCVGGNYSFGSGMTASGSFINCTGGNGSFGGLSNFAIFNGNATGNFINCTGGNNSFGGQGGGAGGTASGKFLRCTTTGIFYTLSGNGKYRLCIDGNYDVINADAPPPPPPRTLYFNNAVDTDWQTLGNWWNDAGFTSQATSLPTSSDSVVAFGNITSNSGSEPTVVDVTLNDASGASNLFIAITVNGNATFNGSSLLFSTVTGNATFNDSSINGGTVTGNATFNDSSANGGIVTGNATFNDSSINGATVTGTATFNDSACNQGGTAGTFVPDPPPTC